MVLLTPFYPDEDVILQEIELEELFKLKPTKPIFVAACNEQHMKEIKEIGKRYEGNGLTIKKYLDKRYLIFVDMAGGKIPVDIANNIIQYCLNKCIKIAKTKELYTFVYDGETVRHILVKTAIWSKTYSDEIKNPIYNFTR